MKIKKIIFSIIAVLFIATACEEDFLERLPLDQVSTMDYWTKTGDLELYTNQFYPSFSDGSSWSGGIYWLDTGTDDMASVNYSRRLAGLTTVPATGGWSYTNIRRLNFFFENYENCEDDFEVYKHYVGEAHFFRAFYYFGLLRTYGDVPWIDKTLLPDSEELYAARTPRNTIVNNIVADLDKAIEYMVSGVNIDGMRLNKEIALLFKARVCLYEGTWEKYHAGTVFGVTGGDPNSLLTKAADAAKQVIDSDIYSLYSTGDPNWDYWHLFNPLDYTGNPEIMLWKKYDLGLNMYHNHQRYLPRIGHRRGNTKSCIDDYLCSDGLPIALSPLYQGDNTLTLVSTNRDPRWKQTIFTPGWPREIVGSDTTWFFDRAELHISYYKCNTAYQLNKGAVPDPNQYYAGNVGTNPSPIFRYAEALLIFAEAKAELGTLTQGDVDISIKLLRDRAGMPNLVIANIQTDPNWLYPSLSPIINEVRRERHVELNSEGYRWDDLCRWRAHHLIVGKNPRGARFDQATYPELTIGVDVDVDADGYIILYVDELPNGYGFVPDRDYLAPIPVEQLTLNTNLVQNPGWQ